MLLNDVARMESKDSIRDRDASVSGLDLELSYFSVSLSYVCRSIHLSVWRHYINKIRFVNIRKYLGRIIIWCCKYCTFNHF